MNKNQFENSANAYTKAEAIDKAIYNLLDVDFKLINDKQKMNILLFIRTVKTTLNIIEAFINQTDEELSPCIRIRHAEEKYHD